MKDSEREEIKSFCGSLVDQVIQDQLNKYLLDKNSASEKAMFDLYDFIMSQVAKARAEAIEECAKIAIESESQYCLSEDEKNTAIRIAEAIRRRLYE